MPEPRAIVVGAGISGLTAAWRLQQRGVETTVLEAEPHVGGKMHSIERDGYRINTGAGIYSGSYKSLLGVVDELGLSASITTPLNTIGIVKDGTPHYIRGDGIGALIDFVRTPLISPRSKLLLTRLVWDSMRNRGKVGYAEAAGRAELDTESVADYCDRRLNAELRDRFIGPLLGGVWVLDGREMSVADLYFLVARFLGGGLRGYRGGTDFVARALAERLDVRTSAPVTLVERTDDGARVVWSEDGTERDEQVDGAILTVCAPHVPPIYPGLEPELQGILLEGLPQATYGTLRVALDRRPEVEAAFLCVPTDERSPIGTVAFEHLISPGAAPPGKGLLAVFLSHEWASTRMDLSDEAWIDAALPELDRLIPGVAETVNFIEVSRWEYATPRSVPGSHKMIDRLDRAFDDGRRVQHAGDYMSVASIEGSVVSGEVAAERLAAALSA